MVLAAALTAVTTDDRERETKDFFLARQPILNIEQELIGYELLFRSTAVNRAAFSSDMAATAAVIEHAAELGLHNVIGSLTGFINVDAGILMSDIIHVLPKDNVVLEILETVELTPQVIERIAQFAATGYVFAIDDVIEESARTELLMPLAGIVKVDVLAVPSDELAALSRSLKLKGKKLLAEKIETFDIFKACREYGFDYFQGYYFARPDILRGKKLSTSQVLVMQVLGQIVRGANNYEIVRYIKQDVALSLMLLRLVNTPLCGFRRHIASLGQALMVLGDRQLKRWLQILLYANQGDGPAAGSSPLMMQAATRGKMCELLAQKIHPRRSNRSDTAFTVGVLSLTDALFNMEIAEIIKQIGVTMEVQEALLSRAGFYGGLLELVELSEKPEMFSLPLLHRMLETLQLSPAEFYSVQKETFEWCDSISENMGFDSGSGTGH